MTVTVFLKEKQYFGNVNEVELEFGLGGCR